MSVKRVILVLSLAVLAATGLLCAYGMASEQSARAPVSASGTVEADGEPSAAPLAEALRETGTANPVSGMLRALRYFDTILALLSLAAAAVAVLLLRGRDAAAKPGGRAE